MFKIYRAKHMKAENIPTSIWNRIKSNVMTRIGFPIAVAAAVLSGSSVALAKESNVEDTATQATQEQQVDVNEINSTTLENSNLDEIIPVVENTTLEEATKEEATPVVENTTLEETTKEEATPVVENTTLEESTKEEATPIADSKVTVKNSSTIDEKIADLSDTTSVSEEKATEENKNNLEYSVAIDENNKAITVVSGLSEDEDERNQQLVQIHDELVANYSEDVLKDSNIYDVTNEDLTTNDVQLGDSNVSVSLDENKNIVFDGASVASNEKENDYFVHYYQSNDGKIHCFADSVGLSYNQRIDNWNEFISAHPEYANIPISDLVFDVVLDDGTYDATGMKFIGDQESKQIKENEKISKDPDALPGVKASKPDTPKPTPTPTPKPEPTPEPQPTPTPVVPTPDQPKESTPVQPVKVTEEVKTNTTALPQTGDPALAAGLVGLGGLGALAGGATLRKRKKDDDEGEEMENDNLAKIIPFNPKHEEKNNDIDAQVDEIMNQIYAKTGIEAPKNTKTR